MWLVKNIFFFLRFVSLRKIFCVYMYEMSQISKEAYKKCEVEISDNGR